MQTIVLKADSVDVVEYLRSLITDAQVPVDIQKEWNDVVSSFNVYDNVNIEDDLTEAKVLISGKTVKTGTLRELKAAFPEFISGHSANVVLKALKGNDWVTVRQRTKVSMS